MKKIIPILIIILLILPNLILSEVIIARKAIPSTKKKIFSNNITPTHSSLLSKMVLDSSNSQIRNDKLHIDFVKITPRFKLETLSGLVGNITTTLAYGNYLIVGTSNSLVVLNQSNGKRLWSLATAKIIYANVLDFDLDNHVEIVVIMENRTISLISLDRTIKKSTVVDVADISAGFTADINGDGISEVVLGSSTGEVLVMNNTFDVLFKKNMNYGISYVYAKRNEIFIGDIAGYITVLNSSGYEEKRFFVNNAIKKLDVYDIDSDGIDEIIVGTRDGIYVFSNAFEWMRSIINLEFFSFGDVDDDSRTEILACNDSHVYVLSKDGLIKGVFRLGIGVHQVFTIRRGKTITKHLLLTANKTYIILINVTSKTLETRTIRDEIIKFIVNDFDSDGEDEFSAFTLHGLACYFDPNLTQVWISSFGGRAITYVKDVYKDGTEDVILAYANGIVEIINNNGKILRWIDIGQEVKYIDFYNFDLDPYMELCIATSSSCWIVNENGSSIWVYTDNNLNAITAFFLGSKVAIINQTKILYLNTTGYVVKVRVLAGITGAVACDTNGDNKRELVIFLLNGSIICFNENDQEIWRQNVGSQVIASAISDVNLDGKEDVLCATSDSIVTIENGSIIRVYNIKNVKCIHVDDVDGDSINEILLSNATHVFAIDYKTNKTELIIRGDNIVGVISGDVSGDKEPDIIIAHENLVEVYSKTEKIVSVDIPAQIYDLKYVDTLSDLIADTIVETSQGIYLLSPKKMFRIIAPENATWFSTRTINITYEYWGFVPSEFVIYANNSEIQRTNTLSQIITLEKDGVWNIQVRAIPVIGESLVDEITIYVDTNPPSLEVNIENNTWFASNTIELKWNSSDNFSGFDHVELRIDNGSWIAFSNNSVVLTLSDGQHVLNLRALDKVGNEKIVIIYVNIDTKAPHIELISPNNESWFNTSSILVTWNASDYGIGVNVCYIQVNDGPKVYLSNNSILLSNLGDGSYIIKIGAIDKLGHESCISVKFFVDTKAPVVNIVDPLNGTITNNPNITVKWIYEEENLVGFYIKIDNESWMYVYRNTSFTISLTHGGHWVYVKAIDKAKNVAIASLYVYIDMKPPIITITSLANNTTINASVISRLNITWNVTDDTSVVGVWISIDYGPWIFVDLRNSYTIDVMALEEGFHVISFKAEDLAGNTAEINIVFYVVKPKPQPEKISWVVYLVVAESILLLMIILLRLRGKNSKYHS